MRLGIYRPVMAPMVALNRMQNGRVSPNSGRPFFYYHLRSVLLAALAFGLTHGGQMLVVGFIRNDSLSLKLSALITVLVFETIQSLVFILIGLVVAYAPSRVLEIVLRKSPASKRLTASLAEPNASPQGARTLA